MPGPSPSQSSPGARHTGGDVASGADDDRFPLPRANPFDPPPRYAELGASHPVRRVRQWNGAPAWFVTGYDNVRALLQDPRTSVDATNPAYPAQNAALAFVRKTFQVFAQMDPPGHTVERKMVAAEFTGRAVEAMRPKVQAIVDRLVGRILARPRTADLVADFAQPLPCHVICTLLGAPDDDHHEILEIANTISSTRTTPEEAASRITAFCEGYLTDLVRAKSADPGDDALSRLIVNHMRTGEISERKVVSLARLFLTAGHESTTGTLGTGLAALLYHPEQLEKLRADPTLIRGAVEEILRYTDVTHSGRLRVATADIEIAGVTIRAGEAIIMHQPTGDRDERVFPDPHRFDITRTPKPHLAFGAGIHHCIGQPLARLELQLGIGTLVARIPTLRATEPLEALRFHHRMAIYGLEALPVAW